MYIGAAQDCYLEGESGFFQCSVPAGAEFGLFEWIGYGFSCPSLNSIISNKITFLTSSCPLHRHTEHSSCGIYFANLTCTENGTELISSLTFRANYSMNGESVECRYDGVVIQSFMIRIFGGK